MASVFPDTSVNNPATGAAWNDGDFWKDPNTSITYVWEDPVWKGYSEGVTPLGDYVQIIGDNMTGDLTLGTDKITLDATGGSITANGSATFGSALQVGGSPFSGTNDGVIVQTNGRITASAANGSDVWNGFTTSGNKTTIIGADGSATFSGPLTVLDNVKAPKFETSSYVSSGTGAYIDGISGDAAFTGTITAKGYSMADLDQL